MGKKKKRQKEIQTQLHQHQDMKGRIFGKAHPLKVSHKNKITQADHEITLGNERMKELRNG